MDYPLDLDEAGRRLAYVHATGDFGLPAGVYVMELDSLQAAPQLIVPGVVAPYGSIRFSADGESLYLAITGEVEVLSLSDSNRKTVSSAGGDAATPDPSPDGQYLIYNQLVCSYDEGDTCGLFIIDLDRGAEAQVRSQGQAVGGLGPRFGPGERIAFSRSIQLNQTTASRFHPHLVSPDGNNLVDLAPESPLEFFAPCWFGANAVVFLTQEKGGSDVWFTRFQLGDGHTDVLELPVPFGPWDFTADGVTIVYVDADSDGCGVVYSKLTSDPDGDEKRQLTGFHSTNR